MTKRFIEFMTQNTDDGELNYGFKDMLTGKWYYTKDKITGGEIIDLLNELDITNLEVIDTNKVGYEISKILKEENEKLKTELARTKVLLSNAEKNYSDLLKIVHRWE